MSTPATATLGAIADSTETQAALDAGLLLAQPRPIGDEEDPRFYVVTVPAGAEHDLIDLDVEREKTALHPARKTGRVALHTAEAFVDYVGRHAVPESEVFASIDDRQVIAVIDSDGARLAGRKEHRAVLELKTPPAWVAWTKVDGKLLGQVEFAEFLEDHLPDVVSPSAATLLEIVTTFTAKKGLDFESSTRLQDGQTQLVYKETINATAGRTGELAIPERIELALSPFRGVDPFKVTARLRVRITPGGLGIGVIFDQLDKVIEAAFEDVVDAIRVGLGDSPAAGVVLGWPTR